MIKKIKEEKLSPRYKAQKLFVLTDVGKNFKYRFCVIGIPAKMYRFTRYFRTEIEACFYFEEVLERNKDFVSSENRGFESANFNKKRGGEVRSLYRRLRKKGALRRDCDFKRKKK
jgi:hypothetical protein